MVWTGWSGVVGGGVVIFGVGEGAYSYMSFCLDQGIGSGFVVVGPVVLRTLVQFRPYPLVA